MARMGAGPAPVAPGAAPGPRVGLAGTGKRLVGLQVRRPAVVGEGRACLGTQEPSGPGEARPNGARRGMAGEPELLSLRPGVGPAGQWNGS